MFELKAPKVKVPACFFPVAFLCKTVFVLNQPIILALIPNQSFFCLSRSAMHCQSTFMMRPLMPNRSLFCLSRSAMHCQSPRPLMPNRSFFCLSRSAMHCQSPFMMRPLMPNRSLFRSSCISRSGQSFTMFRSTLQHSLAPLWPTMRTVQSSLIRCYSVDLASGRKQKSQILWVFPGICVCLGLWQIYRLKWKEDLINVMNQRLTETPVDLITLK